jgi:hypothetical protein
MLPSSIRSNSHQATFRSLLTAVCRAAVSPGGLAARFSRRARQRRSASEQLEARMVMTTWAVGSAAPFTTIFPQTDTGADSSINIFWGGDFPGFNNSYYFYDSNGGTGGFSVELGTNTQIEFLGSSGNDSVNNESGNGVGVSCQLTAYGKGGNDTFHGGKNYDKLFGGPGNDQLYGEAGDDVLYGGASTDSDQLYGGTGMDRFYVRDVDTNNSFTFGANSDVNVKDKHGLDSIVHFMDTSIPYPVNFGAPTGTITFDPKAWSDPDIEIADRMFNNLHNTIFSERFAQQSNGGETIVVRNGANTPSSNILAFSNTEGIAWFPDYAFTYSGLGGVETSMVHEITGHNYDKQSHNPHINDFRAVSGWTFTQPASFGSYASWKANWMTWPAGKFVQSSTGQNAWFDPQGRSPDELFAREYAGSHPQEDFAVTAEAWYQRTFLNDNEENLVGSKQDNLDLLFDDLKAPVTPTNLQINAQNPNLPTFTWDTLVADGFHVTVRNLGTNTDIDDVDTADLTYTPTATLPPGNYAFRVQANVVSGATSQVSSKNFSVNGAPSFTSTPVTTATEDTAYTYNVTATDANGDPITITAPTLPGWLTLIDHGNGTATLSGTPINSDVGSNDVVLEVSDGIAVAVQQSFTINVANTNDAPTFTSAPVDSATEDTLYSYDVTTQDDDAGAVLTITAPTLPTWLTFTDNGDGTATLSGTPANSDVGQHAVVLNVSDGLATVQQSFTLTVSNVNDAPALVLLPTGILTYAENMSGGLVLAPSATLADIDSTDFDGGKLTVAITANASSNDHVFIKSGTPGPGVISVSGTDVFYGSDKIGVVTKTGQGATPREITLTADASVIATRALVRAIGFFVVGDAPTTTQRTIRFVLTDGDGGTSAAVTKLVKVVAVNDAPVVTVGGQIGYVRNRASIPVSQFATVTDADSTNFYKGALRVHIAAGASQTNRLVIGGSFTIDAKKNVRLGTAIVGTLTGSGYATTDLVVSLKAAASPTIVQQLLRSIKFYTVRGAAGTRGIEVTLSDDVGGTSNKVTKLVKVT